MNKDDLQALKDAKPSWQEDGHALMVDLPLAGTLALAYSGAHLAERQKRRAEAASRDGGRL